MLEVFSSGGGTQSAAIAALIIQGKLPKPDLAAIMDTGREKRTTWEYHDQVIVPALKAVGVDLVRIGPGWISMPEHGKNWLSHNRNTVLIPAFSNQTGEVSKLSGFCTKSWKQEAFNRWASKIHGVKRSQMKKWIGYSLDEQRRWLAMMNGEEYKSGLIRFPLVHDFPLRRSQSIQLVVQEMGWPMPPRSACWMCPNQTDDEWRETKRDDPEHFAEAIALDNELRTEDGFAFLHRSCLPLEKVDFEKPAKDPEDDLFTRACNSGGCFT